MPESSYEITPQDIRNYLAGLEPGEEAGIIEHPLQCLVARALNKKYSQTFHVDSDRFGVPSTGAGWLEVPQEIQIIIGKFDAISTMHASITRQQVEEAIPALKA